MNPAPAHAADKPPARRRKPNLRERREATFLANYAKRRPAIVAADLFAEVAARFAFPVKGDWRRARCAALTAACEEYERVAVSLSGGKARRLVVGRFQGLPLGESSTGKEKLLRLGPLTLWRALRLWGRSGRVSPAAFTMQLANVGRRPKR